MVFTILSSFKKQHKDYDRCKLSEFTLSCDICSLENLINEKWKLILADEFDKSYFNKIKFFLHGKSIYPKISSIFAFTNHFPLEDTKVVILGQDPYHNLNQATGLAFSVPSHLKIPPSLRNIYKELQNDIPDFKIPLHGNLESWARQGVLLLNDILTVEHNKPGSHSKIGWKEFTGAILEKINKMCENVVFILWGNYAKLKSKNIDHERHLVLMAAHPSPFSVTKFYGCKHFSRTNEYLIKCGKTPINWNIE
ncbi:uracil-DNA glycosylase [Vairimorpha necatrix]|uniref:Uracil-DNA glycosylase n=1 Tax=Vairimorpha necatrix TaxID=6039 RepID=A0AAX4JEC7_9MICR